MCEDFWGILGIPESVIGNYCVVKTNVEVVSVGEFLGFQVWALSEFYAACNRSFLATFRGQPIGPNFKDHGP